MDEVYTEEMASALCAIANQRKQAAQLLNTLASGGVASLTPRPEGGAMLVFISAEQVAWLASDGEEGHA